MNSLALAKSDLRLLLTGRTTALEMERRFTNVEFDSRNVRPGSLFICLKGEQVHGHSFLDESFARGATLALVEDKQLLHSAHGDRVIVVRDTLQALQTLAAHWRAKLQAALLGITGSLGKTTVKEIAHALLLSIGTGTASKKSFNGQVGAPYTLCQAKTSDAWIALEMGMNQAGELHTLSLLAKPNAVVITTIAPVHIGHFQSLENIADAKFEILDGLKPDGVIAINGDDPHCLAGFTRWKAINQNHPASVLRFGQSAACDVRISAVVSDTLAGTRFMLHYHGKEYPCTIPFLGAHNALNAAAALAGVLAIHPTFNVATAPEIFSTLKPPPMRLNVIPLNTTQTILDDSYNASPNSVKEALKTIQALRQPQMKVGVILGDMLELGEHAAQYHAEIGEALTAIKPDFVLAVGEFASSYLAAPHAAGIIAEQCSSPAEAGARAAELGFNLLLVKGSRGIHLEEAVAVMTRCLP
jgi:UDP-N-acetylmuramoyl-tripeptide--D-alanyl-D-alanine ligase